MTAPIIQLKALGIDDLMKFEWVTAPPAESALRALEGLVAAGMLGEDGRLTPVGEKVAECPVEVNIARMVSFLPCTSPAVRSLSHSAFQFQGAQMRRGSSDYRRHDSCTSKFSANRFALLPRGVLTSENRTSL
jgi:HrpA-like RNA helicase